jgi:hypothetical protein
MSTFKAKRLRSGEYEYRGFIIRNLGYYPPEQRVVWECHDPKTQEGFGHDYSLKACKFWIDEEIKRINNI